MEQFSKHSKEWILLLKKTLLYKERDENRRNELQEKIKGLVKESLIFIDESAIDTFVARKLGPSLRGKKIYGEISGRRYARQSFVAAKVASRIIAPMIFEGTCHSGFFETWIEKFLIRELVPWQIVIMDNATFHKSAKTRELVEQSSCQLLFLPSYSPDLNSIEKLWAWLKKKIQETIGSFKRLEDTLCHTFKNL